MSEGFASELSEGGGAADAQPSTADDGVVEVSRSPEPAAAAAGGADTAHADKMDDGEIFDQMEMDRVTADDPDSLAFFQAHKKMRETAGLNKSMLMRKQHNKRHS